MSYLHIIHTLVDDEQQNREYVATLTLESESATLDWPDDDDAQPVLIDVEVTETRVLDSHGDVERRCHDITSAARVVELLDDPLELKAAIHRGHEPPGESMSAKPGATGRLRHVVARQRAAIDRRLREKGAG